ncbi:hypothetical protein EV421DRAFT_1501332 [Armillaria borealis]|uniref:Uncharacterized protein n=1 Tax=Armillaria borealis TaxID=47425 RepID=A0AA39MG28_9AGAR|nr:hypothetical protein EV421DRAFT_1501332 [Armillaria borealis]
MLWATLAPHAELRRLLYFCPIVCAMLRATMTMAKNFNSKFELITKYLKTIVRGIEGGWRLTRLAERSRPPCYMFDLIGWHGDLRNIAQGRWALGLVAQYSGIGTHSLSGYERDNTRRQDERFWLHFISILTEALTRLGIHQIMTRDNFWNLLTPPTRTATE